MKKVISAVCTAAVIFAAAAQPPMSVCAVNEEKTAQVKKIPVYRKSMSEKETLDCLFFDDMPNVPYLAMEVYYSTFMEGKMTVKNDGRGKYTYTEEKYGETASADAENDIFSCDNAAGFVSTPVFKVSGYDFIMGGPDEMAKVTDIDYKNEAAAMTIDLGGYGIDLREKDGVLYFPFATLCDLFNNTDVLTAIYSDGKIFFVSMYEEVNGGEARSEDMGNLMWLTEKDRPDDMADFAYKELCMSTEYFYGYPNEDNPFSEKMKVSGLDAALEEFDPYTKTMLQSTVPGEYLAGLTRLFLLDLGDGGHTGFSLDDKLTENISNSETYSIYMKKLNEGLTFLPDYYVKFMNIVNRREQCIQTRKNILGNRNYYSEGNTAYIIIDSFFVDYKGWKSYFSGESSVMPNDSISIVYTGFSQAKYDGGIKNVVIDLTANTGGDTVALDTICGMICGEYTMSFEELLGGRIFTQTYSTDRNLDGRIDENDKKVSYDEFNIAVMTSSASFSCGNLMPCVMKDSGFMILGEQSGGGGCAVLMRTTADGLPYQMSSYCKFNDKNGNDVEQGIPVDVSLAVDENDVSAFYDVKKVGAMVEEYYKNDQTSQPGENSDISDVSSVESSDGNLQQSSDTGTSRNESSAPVQSSTVTQQSTQTPSQSAQSSVSPEYLSDSGSTGVSGTAVTIAVVVGAALAMITAIVVIAVVITEKKRKKRY